MMKFGLQKYDMNQETREWIYLSCGWKNHRQRREATALIHRMWCEENRYYLEGYGSMLEGLVQ